MTQATSVHTANWQTHTVEEKYDNPWIHVSHRTVTAPTGNAGIYGLVHFKNVGIGIVPIDEHGYTWLVGQQRYTLQSYVWEIPEGGAPLKESALAAAQRELREETGIIATRWTTLLRMHTSNSVTDEVGLAFVAQDLSFGHVEPDATEQLQIQRVPLDDAINMAIDGTLTDSLTMMSLMKVRILLDRGELIV